MKLLVLALLALILSSCSSLGTVQSIVATAAQLAAVGSSAELSDEAKATLAGAETTYEEAKAAADLDGDGETTAAEWLAWILKTTPD